MKTRLLILLAILLLPGMAMARDYQQDPFNDHDFTDKPTLLEKVNETNKRLELGLNYSTSLIEKYTSHNGILATIGYHFHDTFALEIYGGYMFGKYNNMVTAIKDEMGNAAYKRDPNIPNREMMTWVTDLVMMWTPIYGKVNIVSELAISGNIYFLLGAGVNGIKTINYQDIPESGVKFNFQWGAGGRIYLTKWMALRLEYRDIDYIGHWSHDKNNNRTSGIPDYTYITMNHMFHVGLSFFPF